MSAEDQKAEEPYDAKHRPHDVLPSLMDVLSKAVDEAAGEDEVKRRKIESDVAELLPWKKPRGRSAGKDPQPTAPRTVADYLIGKRRPKYKDLERFVAAVALETGADRITLWKLAIEQVDDRVKSPEADERMQAIRTIAATQRRRNR